MCELPLIRTDGSNWTEESCRGASSWMQKHTWTERVTLTSNALWIKREFKVQAILHKRQWALKLLYHEEKHCLSVSTHSSRISEPPHQCMDLKRAQITNGTISTLKSVKHNMWAELWYNTVLVQPSKCNHISNFAEAVVQDWVYIVVYVTIRVDSHSSNIR